MKGVEIGDGFANALAGAAREVHDELSSTTRAGYRRETNRAGGIEGGMSNGEPIVVRIAMKPMPTLMKPLRTAGSTPTRRPTALVERSDTTAIAAAAVVGGGGRGVRARPLRCARSSAATRRRPARRLPRPTSARIPWRPALAARRAPRWSRSPASWARASRRSGALLAERLGGPSSMPTPRSSAADGRPIRRLFARGRRGGLPGASRRRSSRELLGAATRPAWSRSAAGRCSTARPRASSRRERDAGVARRRRRHRLGAGRARAGPAAARRRPRALRRALRAERRPVYAAAADAIVDAGAAPEVVAGALAWQRLDASRARSRGSARLAGDRARGDRGRRAVDERCRGAFRRASSCRRGGGQERRRRSSGSGAALAAAELERRDLVVSAGGGTVTDVGGFAPRRSAAGSRWIAVPTTLVGQVDAAIGGKTAINVAAKNDVGAFWLPEA